MNLVVFGKFSLFSQTWFDDVELFMMNALNFQQLDESLEFDTSFSFIAL